MSLSHEKSGMVAHDNFKHWRTCHFSTNRKLKPQKVYHSSEVIWLRRSSTLDGMAESSLKGWESNLFPPQVQKLGLSGKILWRKAGGEPIPWACAAEVIYLGTGTDNGFLGQELLVPTNTVRLLIVLLTSVVRKQTCGG